MNIAKKYLQKVLDSYSIGKLEKVYPLDNFKFQKNKRYALVKLLKKFCSACEKMFESVKQLLILAGKSRKIWTVPII